MEKISGEAADPEVDLWDWLRTGAPLGEFGDLPGIPVSGIFPPVEVERREPEEFEQLVARVNAAQFSNYKSFEEEPELARGEIERMVQAHFSEGSPA